MNFNDEKQHKSLQSSGLENKIETINEYDSKKNIKGSTDEEGSTVAATSKDDSKHKNKQENSFLRIL